MARLHLLDTNILSHLVRQPQRRVAERIARRIHVERFNPALRLYKRLGFRQVEDKGVSLFLEWRAT